ncbi:MAG: heavy-metal-associated domain-containing protein [Wenzhouxiangella sp.]
MNKLIQTTLMAFLLALLSAPLVADTADAEAKNVRVEVNGLVCAFCARGIRNSFNREEATADVLVSLENRLVAVEFKSGMSLSDEAITKLLTDAGYSVVGITRTDESVAAIRLSIE